MTWRYEEADFGTPVETEIEANAVALYEARIKAAAESSENCSGQLYRDGEIVAWFEIRRKL